MRFQRLLDMSLPELASRGRQEISKRLERLGMATPLVSRMPDAHLRDRFRDAVPHRFFPGATHEDTPLLFGQQMAEARDRLISTADSMCAGRFDLLGHRGLSFGDPIDWRLDPISGRRAPLVHWSRLDPLDVSVVGDSKVVWELNRHQWLIPMGQAYQLTHDERYAEVFAQRVREWLAANPPGIGINWTSSLEIALRLISWCWALVLFRGCRSVSPDLFGAVLSSLCAHASHVERYLSHYFSPNTHLTGEALGLFYAGSVFPDLPDARRWRTLGARVLTEQIERQVLPDGVYFEQSMCYERYAVDTYLHFLILAERNGLTVPSTVATRIQLMLDFLMAMRRPDGSLPEIGDADGGRLVPLAPRAPDDFSDVFSTAAALFNRADYAWAAKCLAPETLWMLGPTAISRLESLNPAPPTSTPSRRFADGGYVVMATGWEGDAHHLIFDVGPLGCPVSGGHGHADLLSIQCSIFGEPYLVDPGTYVYAAEPAWRDHFRSTGAHSTVVVDGVGQATPNGPFRWEARPSARLQGWRSTPVFDFADASHDAYGRPADPVTHRRRLLFVKPHYWVVVDDLDGGGEHAVDLHFQFAPVDVSVDPQSWVRAHGRGGGGLLLRAFAPVPLKCDIQEGEVAPTRGWVSHHYGVRRPAPLLTWATVTRLPIRIATLLWPTQDISSPPPAVVPVMGKGRGPTGLIIDARNEIVRFDEPEFTVERR